jgi:hypothetical protein
MLSFVRLTGNLLSTLLIAIFLKKSLNLKDY